MYENIGSIYFDAEWNLALINIIEIIISTSIVLLYIWYIEKNVLNKSKKYFASKLEVSWLLFLQYGTLTISFHNNASKIVHYNRLFHVFFMSIIKLDATITKIIQNHPQIISKILIIQSIVFEHYRNNYIENIMQVVLPWST